MRRRNSLNPLLFGSLGRARRAGREIIDIEKRARAAAERRGKGDEVTEAEAAGRAPTEEAGAEETEGEAAAHAAAGA